MINILIVDDDELFSLGLSDALAGEGRRIFSAATLSQGLRSAHSRDMDIVFLDMQFPEGSGMDILPNLKALPNSPEIIVITGSLEEENAETAIREGAWDFIKKTSSQLEMKLSCERALDYRSKRMALFPVQREGIVGSSPGLMSCLEETAKAARSQAEVLFTGETGTGKEVFARALHANSPRRDQNLVVVDCASMTETIAGSELFGYRKGAFTGATSDKPGLIYQADKGTLFLDEVSELPLSLQKSFLRVLENQTYRPLGQSHESVSNFRLVCASNRDLHDMVRKEEFREDLLFRIQTVTINIPPLRDRLDDLEDLVSYYLREISRELSLPRMSASPDLTDLFASYDWPGNVRELVNVLKALSASAPQERVLYPSHLPRDLHVMFLKHANRSDPHTTIGKPMADPVSAALKQELLDHDWKSFCKFSRAEYEKKYLKNLMKVCDNDIDKAMIHSGLSKPRLYSLLKKYSIPRPSRIDKSRQST
ncbi:sigma-54-dependent transcriptional regulator [Desulfonatronovibrio magnus]|uniref:sigma-54-dependent transcriptional regulator n=1 Tax=Desulfonatronovibrio magnus TaxID=698827 RepID=UPI0005EB5CCB|nr:sigma-54 dependent transcriptional regulator [Desulfonatronovibrio magnus]